MAAIYFGVTHGAIHRLAHTFNHLGPQSRQYLKSLGETMNPNDGFATYMEQYLSQKAPKIPFL